MPTLNDVKIRNAKPSEERTANGKPKPVRLFDGGGLYLEVSPAGGKLWRLKYRFQRREKRLSFGMYPDIGLRDARERRDAARKLLAHGIDPSAARKAEKAAQADTFEPVAREWLSKQAARWGAGHAGEITRALRARRVPAGSAPGPSARSRRPSCWPACAASRPGAQSRLRAGSCRTRAGVPLCHGHRPRRARHRGGPAWGASAGEGHTPRGNYGPQGDRRSAARDRRLPGLVVARCALRLAPLTFVTAGRIACGASGRRSTLRPGRVEYRRGPNENRRASYRARCQHQAVECLRELLPAHGRRAIRLPRLRSAHGP